MNVDSKKINLSEKDVEDWLWENPNSIGVVKWVKRQFRVPSGIIDLLGVNVRSDPVVVEVKNVELNSDAILQVCRYAADVEHMVGAIGMKILESYVEKVVVFKGNISNELQYEANSVNVNLRSFDVKYELSISGQWNWNRDKWMRDSEMLKELASNPEIIDAFLTQADIDEYRGMCKKLDEHQEGNQ